MERNLRKERIGIVKSNKMNKTILVEIVRPVRHPVYKKVIRLKKNYKVHDEKNECEVGDKVKITETKPLSKDKRWRLKEIMSKAKKIK